MVAQDHRGPGVDKCMSLFDLGGRGDQKTLFAPMDGNNHVMDARAKLADLPDEASEIERGDAPLVARAGKPIGPTPFVHGRQKGHAHAVHLDDGRHRGFIEVHAGPEMPEPEFAEQAAHVLESAVQAVERVVVGQRENVESRGRDRAGPVPPCRPPAAPSAHIARCPGECIPDCRTAHRTRQGSREPRARSAWNRDAMGCHRERGRAASRRRRRNARSRWIGWFGSRCCDVGEKTMGMVFRSPFKDFPLYCLRLGDA